MRQQRLLSTGEVCALLSTKNADFPRKTLDNWCRQGIVRPAVDGGGTGNHRVFNFVPDVLAVGLGRELRAKGFSLEVAGDVTQVLMAYDGDALLQKLENGESCLLIVGDKVCPYLFTKKAVQDTMNEYAPDAVSMGIYPRAIDIRYLYDSMSAILMKREKKSQLAPKPKALAKRG